MNVVSLFDGISCGQLALKNIGAYVDQYLASEIDNKAIQVTQAHFPGTKQLGCVTSVDPTTLPPADLLMGGSPCQGFSSAGKQLSFEDPRSKLFFDFVRILDKTQPKYFLLENVKMSQNSQDIISGYLGVEPIEINSANFTAQNRVRLYWTNISIAQDFSTYPGETLDDILETAEYTNPAAIRGRYIDKVPKTTQCLEVRSKYTNKSNTLTTVDKDNVLTNLAPGRYYPALTEYRDSWRNYTLAEYCKLQGLPINYLDMVSKHAAKKLIGNSWTVPVIAYILKEIL